MCQSHGPVASLSQMQEVDEVEGSKLKSWKASLIAPARFPGHNFGTEALWQELCTCLSRG